MADDAVIVPPESRRLEVLGPPRVIEVPTELLVIYVPADWLYIEVPGHAPSQ